jgi:hypothetical protein
MDHLVGEAKLPFEFRLRAINTFSWLENVGVKTAEEEKQASRDASATVAPRRVTQPTGN